MAQLRPTKRRIFFARLHRWKNKLGLGKRTTKLIHFIEYKLLPKQKDLI